MNPAYMEANATLSYLPEEPYVSGTDNVFVGYFETEGDTCDFGGCEISLDVVVGTFRPNVFSDLIKRLNEIRALTDNWDGQGTAAPNKKACFHAWNVIEVLDEMDFSPAKLMPSSDEGIGFYFSNKNKYGFVECYNDGEIVVAMSDRKGYRRAQQIGDTIAEIKDELETLKAFIDAQ
jgi:hypothetical protein